MKTSKSASSSILLAEEVYRLVGRSRRALWMAAARCLEGRDESIFTWQAVCYLVRNGPTNQRDLAYATAQHPAGISRLVDELETSGMVRRTPDKEDRRRLLVQATPKGRAWLESATPHVMGAVDEAMGNLSSSDREELRALLERLLASTVAAPKAKGSRG